jgi:flagellar assembly protein FliH
LPFNTEYAEIHMHPEDISYVEAEYDQEALVENKWILKPEPGYQRGDVIVMTPNSLIDRSVKQRLKQVLGTFVNRTDIEKELNDGPVSTPMPKMQEPTSESNAQHQADGNETVQVSSNEQNAETNFDSSDQESHVENEQGGE